MEYITYPSRVLIIVMKLEFIKYQEEDLAWLSVIIQITIEKITSSFKVSCFCFFNYLKHVAYKGSNHILLVYSITCFTRDHSGCFYTVLAYSPQKSKFHSILVEILLELYHFNVSNFKTKLILYKLQLQSPYFSSKDIFFL